MYRLWNKPIAFAAIICFFLIGLYLDQIGFKSASIIAVAATLVAIFMAPMQVSLIFIVTFIWFQGFLKIVSNYHPMVHVGADLVVIALIFRIMFGGMRSHKKLPPFLWLFALHFGWVFITCFNPYSMSIVSTIAGAKVYVSMFLLYFFGYYLITDLGAVRRLFGVFLGLATIQTLFTIYQGFNGPSSVVALHPGYQIQLNKLGLYAFRPFGLTHVPGGPSVYIYLVMPFVLYFLYASRTKIIQFINLSLLPLIGTALFLCQVRSAIIKAVIAVIFFIGALATSRIPLTTSRKMTFVFGSAAFALLTIFAMNYLLNISVQSYQDNERSMDRSMSSFDLNSMSQARHGAWERFLGYGQEVPFGAGFSRVGAAAGAFVDTHKVDPFFPKDHFFADNLFIAVLIELGFPGVLIISTLMIAILMGGLKGWLTEKRAPVIGPQLAILASLVAIAIGSYGAEGVIHNPESCFFWLFAGVMMSLREPDFNVDPQQIS